MNVTVLGAGRIGGNIARQLAAAGHAVTVAFARDQDALQVLAAEIGAEVAGPAAAVRCADVVVVAVPWTALPQALEEAGPLDGKIVVDTTNQFGPGSKPADGQTAAAFNAARMRGARYTKSFNTLTSGFQAEVAHRDPRLVQWLSGDDAEAKAVVAGLIEDAGYVAVDSAGSRTARPWRPHAAAAPSTARSTGSGTPRRSWPPSEQESRCRPCRTTRHDRPRLRHHRHDGCGRHAPARLAGEESGR